MKGVLQNQSCNEECHGLVAWKTQGKVFAANLTKHEQGVGNYLSLNQTIGPSCPIASCGCSNWLPQRLHFQSPFNRLLTKMSGANPGLFYLQSMCAANAERAMEKGV